LGHGIRVFGGVEFQPGALGIVFQQTLAIQATAYTLTDALNQSLQLVFVRRLDALKVGAANLGGGLVAVIFYQLLLVSPTYLFAVCGFFALALLFGRQLFSDKPLAPLYGSAFSTVLILIGTGTSEYSGEADANFYVRILQITFAVCYVIGALSLLQSLHVRERWMDAGRWLSAKLQRIARAMPGHQEQTKNGTASIP